MSTLSTECLPKSVSKPLPAGDMRRQSTKATEAPGWTCLVLALDRARREQLHNTALASGWRTLTCSTVMEALEHDHRWSTQFALVDLAPEAGGHREGVFRLVERLAERDTALVMLCDDHPTPEAELWARKLGVWLYLPEPNLGRELADLCAEALSIARERSASRATSAASS